MFVAARPTAHRLLEFRPMNPTLPRSAVVCLVLFALNLRAADPTAEIHLGSGAKAGEITDRSAIVHVRLTAVPRQNADRHIPGREGEARLVYAMAEDFSRAVTTPWQTARASEDHSVKFSISDLQPRRRYYYRFDVRANAQTPSRVSETFAFVTAPAASERAPVTFHLTTCQDTRGERTYVPMAAQRVDFCVSAGDTVYYDGDGFARNVAQAWQAYQRMFGLPAIKDYYRNVGGYFMKDDHDYRFNDADPYMKGCGCGTID